MLSYIVLVTQLIEAVKEQQQQIDEQTKQISELKEMLKTLMQSQTNKAKE